MFCDIANSTPLAARLGAEAMHGLLNRVLRAGARARCIATREPSISSWATASWRCSARRSRTRTTRGARCSRAGHPTSSMRDAAGEAGAACARCACAWGSTPAWWWSARSATTCAWTTRPSATPPTSPRGCRASPSPAPSGQAKRRGAPRQPTSSSRTSASMPSRASPSRSRSSSRSEPAAVTGEAAPAHGAIGSASGWPRAGACRAVTRIAGRPAPRAAAASLVIHGEPGAGKSRLRGRGAGAVDGAKACSGSKAAAVSFGRSLSYWPFIEILKERFGITEDDSEVEALAQARGGRARRCSTDARAEIVPYLATVHGARADRASTSSGSKFLDAQAMKRQVFLSMRQLLERLAQRQPVLIVLEDWHWVDQSSIDAARASAAARREHTARRSGSRPAPSRPSPPRASGQPRPRTPACRREEIALAPLAAGAQPRSDRQPGRHADLPEAVRAQIERSTEGNPFFIEEVMRALIADGTLVRRTREGGWRLAQADRGPGHSRHRPGRDRGAHRPARGRSQERAEARLRDRPQLLPAYPEGDQRGGRRRRQRPRPSSSTPSSSACVSSCLSSNTSSSTRWCRRRPTAASWPSAGAPSTARVAQAIETPVCRSPRRVREPARLPLRARRGLGEGAGVSIQGR